MDVHCYMQTPNVSRLSVSFGPSNCQAIVPHFIRESASDIHTHDVYTLEAFALAVDHGQGTYLGDLVEVRSHEIQAPKAGVQARLPRTGQHHIVDACAHCTA